MESMLEKLCWISQEENPNNLSKNLQKALNTFCKYENILSECLTGKELATFNKLIDAICEMDAHIEIDNFISGMKVGAKLVLELLVE